MTDKVNGIKEVSVTICVETKSGYSSTEHFSITRVPGALSSSSPAELTLLNAVDELHRMLLLSGVEPSVLEYRLHDVAGRVLVGNKNEEDPEKQKQLVQRQPINMHGDGYPGAM